MLAGGLPFLNAADRRTTVGVAHAVPRGSGKADVRGGSSRQSITCYTNPCTVMYTMPAGTGNHAVWGNAFNLGEFPAGQVANLGPWWTDQSPVEFTVRGIAAQPAYLYVRGM